MPAKTVTVADKKRRQISDVFCRQLCFTVLLGGVCLFASSKLQGQVPATTETPPAPVSVAEKYSGLDSDGDGKLSEEEFIASSGEDHWPRLRRDFRIFDLDSSGDLSPEEFSNIPSFVPREQRGRFPDPIVDWAENRLAEIEANWTTWDQDGDGSLSRAEFESSRVVDVVPGLAQTGWSDWEQNGRVTLQDCRRIVEAAYGVRRLDGLSLRTTSGLVIDWTNFRRIDNDGDGCVTRQVFDNYFSKRNATAWADRTFPAADKDQDGVLTFSEWTEIPDRWTDPVDRFLRLDRNFDGQLDLEEFVSGATLYRLPVAPFMFRAFDLNGDGHLSLSEYRTSPYANEFMRWDRALRDTNQDDSITPDEISWTSGIELAGMMAEYFRLLDANGDGKLDETEILFTSAARNLKRQFTAQDADNNGELSEQELLAGVDASKQPESRRDFHVFDLDGNGALTYEEYLTIPSLVSREHRGALPDPVVELLEEQFRIIESKWGDWDLNRDGILDEQEFMRSKLQRAVPGLAMTNWADWNRKGDGRLTQNDCRQVLEVSYGVRRNRGEILRTSSGLVVDLGLFLRVDTNGDDQLSLAEFMDFFGKRSKSGPEPVAAEFSSLDKDADGVLTFSEWAMNPRRWFDLSANFLKLDANLDGRLDEAEYLAGARYWQTRYAPYYFRAFDLNRDGFLSLAEFRLAPLANQLVRWDLASKDSDNDGRISLGEFQYARGLEMASLVAVCFRKLDLNQDNYLDLDEYAYSFSRTRAPRSVVFKFWDTNRDGILTFEEVLAQNKQGSSEQDINYEKKIARVESSFHAANVDGNDGLSVREFESQAAHGMISPTSRPARSVAASGREEELTDEQANWRMWFIVGANVLLVGAVSIYLIRRG